MMNLFVIGAMMMMIVTVVHGQFLSASPQICLTGHCHWTCPFPGGDCKGLFYCGPATKSCKLDCPINGCKSEMAVVSHSPGETVINCGSEGSCGKLLVNCGRVDSFYIQELNNLPGSLQQMFATPPLFMHAGAIHPPYGKCTVNCVHKACKDTIFLCQGKFADGKSCTANANNRHAFENGFFKCGMENPTTHCQANCGVFATASIGGVLFPPTFQGLTGEPPCHGAEFLCPGGKCYCDGYACRQLELPYLNTIIMGKAPKYIPPVTGPVPQASSTPAPKSSATPKTGTGGGVGSSSTPKKTTPKTGGGSGGTTPKTGGGGGKKTTPKKTTTPPVTTTPMRVYVNNIDAPIKPGFLRGTVYTHLQCGTMLSTCKVICETPGSCSGITLLAGQHISVLQIECSEEACDGFAVESNARKVEMVCKDNGACAGASLTCGSSKAGGLINVGECVVKCQNGGCARHTPRQQPVYIPGVTAAPVKPSPGFKFRCNPGVARCELHADSQNANYQYNSAARLLGMPPNLPVVAQGSFDGGEFDCRVASVGGKPMFGQLMMAIPTCVMKCSTHITRRYCGGVMYKCSSSVSQCQCVDYCTNHVQECFTRLIRGDCPLLSRP